MTSQEHSQISPDILPILTPEQPPAWIEPILARFRDLRDGRLLLVLPEGNRVTLGEAGPIVVLRLNSYAPVRRFLFGGDLGFAESYLDGEWSCDDLTGLFDLVLRNETALSASLRGAWFSRLVRRAYHLSRANSRWGSRRNIAQHYDLGNDFYRRWLDSTMTYSSALFERPSQSLEEAQRHKYRRIAELAELGTGDRVLEIGCGWGGFAEQAVSDHEVDVTGLTLSREQWRYANERFRAGEFDNRARALLCDYRDCGGQYDRVVSIEMFEAVGEENWQRFFAVLQRRLKPGGVAALQVITIADDRFEAYRKDTDFIQRYIFPGGLLPSRAAFADAAAAADFELDDEISFGDSYAHTLAAWRARFQDAWPEIAGDGFDDRFKRMWDYYLAYCEAGFKAGVIDVRFFKLRRPS